MQQGCTTMPNEPLPHQLTVEKLRRLLDGVPDNTVVALKLPPDILQDHDPRFALMFNVDASYEGGPLLFLRPRRDWLKQP
jgi:hypothetical protein